MMSLINEYWEDATKIVQKELGDFLLRVEYNAIDQKYEILKWMPRIQYETVPGFLFGSNKEMIHIGVPDGYYMVQMSFDTWDNRVFEEMRKGRADRLSAKELLYSMKNQKEKIKKSYDNTQKDWERDCIMDMHKIGKPTIYSYSKAGV